MNLEQLTKHQIVLLTLLVSFVTSIATGIVTVSLMGQAPAGVTRVVNQIVEHTVEKVVPSNQGAAVVTTEKTVVVKDDDLAAQSIAAVQKAIVRVGVVGENAVLARGVIVGASGTVLTDRQALAGAQKQPLEVVLAGGEHVAATLRKDETNASVAVLDLTGSPMPALSAAPLADPLKLALGQSVIRIGGGGADTVGSGVVAVLPEASSSLIQTNVSASTPGSLLMTLFGEVIGITTATSLAQDSSSYTVVTLPPALGS